MNILRNLGAVSAATVLLSATVQAQGPGGILPTPQDTPNRQGTRGANWLHIPVGARGAAMAGAVGSSVSGPTGWFWNPAGAATSESFSLAAGRQNLYEDLDVSQNYAAGSMPILGGVVGIHMNTLSSGPIRRTTELNPFGERLGGNTFQWTSTVVGLGYAKRLTDRLSVGGQVKYITEGIPDANTHWTALDVGTQFNTGLYGLVLGGVIQNIAGTSRATGALIQRIITTTDGSVLPEARRVQFYTVNTELPVTFKMSLGADLLGGANSLMGGAGGKHTLSSELSVTHATDQSVQYALAAEYGFRNIVFVRGGKRMYNDDRATSDDGQVGLAGGFGMRLPVKGRNIRFDYSYEAAGALQNIQVFSFEVGK